MNWLEVVGWTGSVLVVVSLMQARVLRFRVLNLVGAAIATVYNIVIDVWPFAAMNGAIAVIDVYWLWRLLRERHDEAAYEVVEVAPDDAYLARVLDVHATDIARFTATPPVRPTRGAAPVGAGGPATAAFLVVRGDETVGVVQLRDEGARTARVLLDYVTPRFRDFTPGEFVYRRSGIFRERGFDRVVVEPLDTNKDYFRRVGFAPQADGTWSRAVAAAA